MAQGEGPPSMAAFRFPVAANRAHQIRWREWGAEAFAAAAAADQPVLLCLTAFWSEWCHDMDTGTWSDPAVIEAVNQGFVALRVDGDHHPHVQDRYIAGGWPTTAFLTPTGEVLWAATTVSAEQFLEVAAGVAEAWRTRREELLGEIARRHQAMSASRSRPGDRGLVRREWADDVLTTTLDLFDPRNGGFGDAPKFPRPEAVEFLYSHTLQDPAAARMADQTLDGMLAGELWDSAGGGFYRYATEADWTGPRREKLLDANAALLEAYSLGAWLRGRGDWKDTAVATVRWVEDTLALPGGLWGGSQAPDAGWFQADREGRRSMEAPPVDATVYTAWNARWIAALANAGARLEEPAWVERAEAALATLLREMAAPGGGLCHFRDPGGEPTLDTLLMDTLEAARAALAVSQASGHPRWLETARTLVRQMEAAWGCDDGGFWDRTSSPDDMGALRYRERPFEANAAAARLLLDLAQITGDRGRRAVAERTLAFVGPTAGRYGPDGALFALAASEFFEAPPAVVIALPPDTEAAAAAELRRAAFALAVPQLRVWTVAAGHRVGPVAFEAPDGPAAWVWTQRGCSGPLAAGDIARAAATRHA
jgi:uncharacterized protein